MSIATETTAATATPVILPVASLAANDYNPNEMTTEQMAELVAEVRHLGRLPKPVIVRPNGHGYVIVDGEHGWRAAQTVGLTEVPCEIVEVDEFEARRQTFKRNQHGTHHPVRLGEMFQQMMTARAISQRALAAEIEVSEGTVRNALVYAEAAGLRNSYAAARKKPVAIETLTVRQVRAYVALPPAIGNVWLDCEASIAALYNVKTDREVELSGELSRLDRESFKDLTTHFGRLERTGLVPYLKSMRSAESFRKGMQQVGAWHAWESRWCMHGLTQEDIRPYTRHHFAGVWTVREPASMNAHLDLLIDTSACLTKGADGRTNGCIPGIKPRFHLTPEEFETVVLNTKSISECHQHLHALVVAKTGAEPGRDNQRKLQLMELAIANPAYLNGSTLPTDQQHALWRASGWTNNKALVARGPTVSLDEAKRELAQLPRVYYEGKETVEEAIERLLQRYYDRAVIQVKVDTLTPAQMVETITLRMPIYDTKNPSDRQAMAVMAATLMHLTRPELLCLFEYSEHLERIREWGILTAALRMSRAAGL